MTDMNDEKCTLYGIKVDRAHDLVKQFARARLLVIGDVMMDRYVFGKVERLNPEAPVPILHAKSEKRETGGAGNTAKNAVTLGAKATLVSVVGGGPTGAELEQVAAGEGYRTVFVRDPQRQTIEKKRYIVASQQMLRVDYEETHDISGTVEESVVSAIEREAGDADAIVVSDYAKGLLTEAVARAITSAAARHGVPVMADAKPSHITYFKEVTYISPNRKEAHEYLGLNHLLQGGCANPELARMLRERFKANVFMTLSDEGMYVLGRDVAEGRHVPQVHRIEVADTSGCGDTAAVAITLAKLAGATDVEAAQVANAAGAVIASKVGAVALNPKELLDMLLQQ